MENKGFVTCKKRMLAIHLREGSDSFKLFGENFNSLILAVSPRVISIALNIGKKCRFRWRGLNPFKHCTEPKWSLILFSLERRSTCEFNASDVVV